MYILGINGRPTTQDKRHRGHGGNHNSSACILKDGKLIAFVEEERFTHVKQDGSFPINAINYCLKTAKISLDKVEHIAIGWSSFKHIFFMRMKHFAKSGLVFRAPTFCAGMCYYAFRDWLSGDIQGAFKREFPSVDFKTIEFHFIEHHLAHAASTFRASGFENAAIMTMDGAGETTATMLAKGRGNKIIVEEEFKLPDSLGFCYSGFTEYLGFQKNNDEYKVMGLACYAKPKMKVDDILKINKDGSYTIAPDYIFHFSVFKRKYNYSRFVKRYGAERPNDNVSLDEHHMQVAASIQQQLERAGVALAKRLTKKTKDTNLCLAGGVALNCKMNKAIREESGIKNIFIQPAAADMGVAFGAAMEVYANLGHNAKFKMEHAYWGPEYTNAEILKALKKNKLKSKKSRDIAVDAAELISKDNVVGWFQGRMEVGPRALGNRSILANPCTVGMNDIVNEKIKFREKWRPFCPSLLDEAKDKYFQKPYESPYMILTFTVRKEMRDKIPAVVHVDGTARPQTVTESSNPKYYRLIKEFGNRTGHPIVMNTSFNIKGDTIVNTPDDAIRTFLKTDMDALAIGDYLVLKEKEKQATKKRMRKT